MGKGVVDQDDKGRKIVDKFKAAQASLDEALDDILKNGKCLDNDEATEALEQIDQIIGKGHMARANAQKHQNATLRKAIGGLKK